MRNLLFVCFLFCSYNFAFSANDYSKLYGQWKGIKMFQDENTYDGSTFFLPNDGEMILDATSIRMYYYPYFKSAEFKVTYTDKSIIYKINDKKIRCDYNFNGDTLTFKMFYINKVFVKLFQRTQLEQAVVSDLDQFGFRTQKLQHEFELDTLQKEQRKGFNSYDSLGFVPFQFIEFLGENRLLVNREQYITYSRSYKSINFIYNGVKNELKVSHMNGTQDVFLKPITQCNCDSITIPYISVVWADRIRQAIIDEENF